MHACHPPIRTAVAALALAAAGLPALAAPVINNGGFESGLAGWSLANQLGSDGTFTVQSGTASPLNGDPVPAPPQGSNAAMTDAFGPGSRLLYQDFTAVASPGPTTLSFSLFVGNRADRFATPATLDFSIAAINQQLRVDIVSPSADPFSVAPADVLQSIYASAVGDALVSGYTTISADVSALMAAFAGQTLRLRFAEVDNLLQMQMGVDDVRFAASVAEPGSLLLAAAALALLAGLPGAPSASRRAARRPQQPA